VIKTVARTAIVVFFILVVLAVSEPAFSENYGGGNGDPNKPFQISNAHHINQIGANPGDWNSHFLLVKDIDLSQITGEQFNIIGNKTIPFTGVFNGQNHIIENFTYDTNGTEDIGLFGCLGGPNAVVTNLVLVDVNVNAPTAQCVGALLGRLDEGTVKKCYVRNGSVTGNDTTGGLVGHCSGKILLSYNENCTVSAINGTNIGGLAGLNDSSGVLKDCYSSGNVSGLSNIGGLAGTNSGTITHCYATGDVDGTSILGGLVGSDNGGFYKKCFWDSSVNAAVNDIGDASDPNVIGLSTTQLQNESTFVESGWDFIAESENGTQDIWRLCNPTIEYPRLNWVFAESDFLCPDGVQIEDVALMAHHWLQLGPHNTDIAPNGGDGQVDWFDLAFLGDSWLENSNLKARAAIAYNAGLNAVMAEPQLKVAEVWAMQQLLSIAPNQTLQQYIDQQVVGLAGDAFELLVNPGAARTPLPVDPGSGFLKMYNYLLASVGTPEDRAISFIESYLSTEEAGYVLTHQFLVLQWAAQTGLVLPAALTAEDQGLLEQVLQEQLVDDTFSDLYAERMMLLLHYSTVDTLDAERWIEAAVEAQLEDGSWPAYPQQMTYDGESTEGQSEPAHTLALSLLPIRIYLDNY